MLKIESQIRASTFWILMVKCGLIISCSSPVIYEETYEVNESGWLYSDSAAFTFSLSDTSRVLDIGVTLRHSEDYPYRNIWLFLEVDAPGTTGYVDTLELYISDNKGEWLGRKRDGAIEVSALYQHDVKIAEEGDFTWRLVHGMRRELLPGIHSLQLWVQDGEQVDIFN
ncbi:gliding motility lipoprotein GldH [Marinilabiliaceae bacterium ANBcel2]|nr:gliding motility lipoprotein GldH [Marinilabiliaceae bacterium ANBcel2]